MTADRWVGQALGGRYQIEELLGQGGMSSVYKAIDTNLLRPVAIKLIHPHLSNNKEFVRRFESEATAIARLRHPNIVQVYDLTHDGDVYYMVLEFITGETLQTRIKRLIETGQHLAIRDTLRYFIDICKAVEYAHRRGMVHRDIKPANVMLDEDDRAVLMDFGIAHIVGGQQHTATGAVLGTALYMSPEQIQGFHPDARSDIYSIGISLFETLGGRPPFEADSAMTLMRMHLNDPIPDLNNLRTGIPETVRAIVNCALEKDPANRCQTCAEMAAALEQALNGIINEVGAVSPSSAAPQHVSETVVEAAPASTAGETVIEPPEPIEEVVGQPQPPADTTTPDQKPVSGPAFPADHPVQARSSKKTLRWGAAVVGLLVLIGGGFFLYHWVMSLVGLPAQKAAEGILPTATVGAVISPTATLGAKIPPNTPIAAPKELKIAVLVPLTGSVPSFGVMARDGALMAIDEWNARGGVLGMKIIPIIENSQCELDPAVIAANKVINQDQVHYIVGEICSKASIPVSGIANERGVVMISPASTNPMVTLGENGAVKPYVFRACFIDMFQGQVGARFAIENLKVKTAFILFDPLNDYVKGLAEFFELSFTQMGGKIVGKEAYTSTDADFSKILANLVKAKPDMVYLPDYYPVVNRVTRQAKQMGINIPFMGGDGWDSPELDKVSASGGFFTNHFSSSDPRLEVQNFIKVFGERYKNDDGSARVPDAMAVLSYDATNLLIQAIQETGVDDAASVKDNLAKINFNGVSGKIIFDPNHNPIKSVTILNVRDGKIIFDTIINP